MKLFSYNTKKILHFLKRNFFLYLQKWNPVLFSTNLKNKENLARENFSYSGKMELSNSNITIFLIHQETETPEKRLLFSQKKAFLIFSEMETPNQNFLYFRRNFQSLWEESKHFNKGLVMTKEDNDGFKNATKCWICDNDYVDNDVKVRDHCHITGNITGKFSGSSLRDFNINIKLNYETPDVFCNIKKL